LSEFLVAVIIPTLGADDSLLECLDSLERQSFRNFEIIVVDNSGQNLARRRGVAATVLEFGRNLGFGAALNRGMAASRAPYIATLNDDAVAHSQWLEALVRVLEDHPETGMCACQVRLYGDGRLDSAGLEICADGSSKQRAHLEPPERYSRLEEALMPSGSAAIYRRVMLDRIGGFDEDFFLYCEDTDLGLRGRWAGWTCLYAPDAVVHHRYSHSAGRASRLKAYYVERNRLFTALKNFPAGLLWKAPAVSLARYFWHLVYLLRGRGKAAEFRAGGSSALRLGFYVVCAHLAALRHFRALWRKRAAIRRTAKLSPRQFSDMLRAHSISGRRVAEL
jgi:GT2 family glycosyltransferase